MNHTRDSDMPDIAQRVQTRAASSRRSDGFCFQRSPSLVRMRLMRCRPTAPCRDRAGLPAIARTYTSAGFFHEPLQSGFQDGCSPAHGAIRSANATRNRCCHPAQNPVQHGDRVLLSYRIDPVQSYFIRIPLQNRPSLFLKCCYPFSLRLLRLACLRLRLGALVNDPVPERLDRSR